MRTQLLSLLCADDGLQNNFLAKKQNNKKAHQHTTQTEQFTEGNAKRNTR